jgi:hypothetical protein
MREAAPDPLVEGMAGVEEYLYTLVGNERH